MDLSEIWDCQANCYPEILEDRKIENHIQILFTVAEAMGRYTNHMDLYSFMDLHILKLKKGTANGSSM